MEAIGTLVCSKAGRDKGKRFVIVGIFDENHVLVADGELRKVSNPKKKKLKHLQFENRRVSEIEEWLTGDCGVADSKIRNAVQK
ncbi:MAG: KOW domain-containing RNA-binding protein [Clostridia bacterium]|nr:KOW domain-containing RNA-binding protein [Clostridia bacterium]MBQ9858620.1 KOW domain-containing RNA-binding protein [Oscillospiraceae bacterium]